MQSNSKHAIKVAIMVEFFALFQTTSSARSWQVWAGSRLAALFIAAALVLALFVMSPPTLLLDVPAIQSVSLATLDQERQTLMARPIAVPKVTRDSQSQLQSQQKPKLPLQKPVQRPVQLPVQKANTPLRQSPSPVPSTPLQSTQQPNVSARTPGPSPAFTPPRIATAPSGAGTMPATPAGSSNAGSAGGGTAPVQMRSGTAAMLRARECARLDVADRPADCPPNDELMRLLAKQRGPQYRPENAEGFSRNEQAWRGIPPPCLKDGETLKVSSTSVCIRFGGVPSRVRSVREICEARGLGGCAPTPSQAAVNAALEQVKRQEAAKVAKVP